MKLYSTYSIEHLPAEWMSPPMWVVMERRWWTRRLKFVGEFHYRHSAVELVEFLTRRRKFL